MPIRIHFPGLQPDVRPIELVRALLPGSENISTDGWDRRFIPLYAKARESFQIAEEAHADAFFSPYQYEAGPKADEIAQRARARGVPCVFMTWGDNMARIPPPAGAILLRHSLISDRRQPSELAFPAFAEDCLTDTGGNVVERHKSPKPSVGFRGYVSNAPMRLIYRIAGRREKVQGLALRSRLLHRLRRDPRIDCRFRAQQHFSGTIAGQRRRDAADAQEVWRRFVANLLDSDYSLCVRGAGNFSYRFYECLSAGRIPLFINTRCVLPFENQIPWREHCVWVEESEIPRIGEKLIEFHNSLSDAEFVQLQHANRQLWQEWLSPLGFYKKFFQSITGAP